MIDINADTILFHGEPVAMILPNVGATIGADFRGTIEGSNGSDEIEELEGQVADLEGEVKRAYSHMADAFVNVERAIALIKMGNTIAALNELESARLELER